MRATPRPWFPFWVQHSINGELQVGALVPKDVLDALLAVAKAAPKSASPDNPIVLMSEIGASRLAYALAALDRAHPGWREWSS